MAEVRERTEKPDRIGRCFAAADWETGRLWVEEHNDGVDLVLRVVLPGIDPGSDVEIYLGDGVLHIEAHRFNKREETRDTYASAFPYGSFARNIAVAPGTDEDRVKATYTDELLEIRVPVAPARREWVQRIPVTIT
jgi:HSP20 family molecular chaperone IbpA